MDEYIDRKAALRDWPPCDEPADAYKYIRDFPAADVAPVKHGRWEVYRAKAGLYICSECHFVPDLFVSRYCPNCGAKMDGGGDEE